MNGKVYVDWGKLAQIALIIIATVILALNGSIEASLVAFILGNASGYIFGNGKNVHHGTAPAPLIGRRDPEPLAEKYRREDLTEQYRRSDEAEKYRREDIAEQHRRDLTKE